MASRCDQLLGYGLMLISSVLFLYYTFWVIVLPFFDSDHAIHQYFLEAKYAVIVPCFLLILAVGAMGVVVAVVLIAEKITKQNEPKQKDL